jgi:hypothetical protein
MKGETTVAAVLGDLHLTPETMPAFHEARKQLQVLSTHLSATGKRQRSLYLVMSIIHYCMVQAHMLQSVGVNAVFSRSAMPYLLLTFRECDGQFKGFQMPV